MRRTFPGEPISVTFPAAARTRAAICSTMVIAAEGQQGFVASHATAGSSHQNEACSTHEMILATSGHIVLCKQKGVYLFLTGFCHGGRLPQSRRRGELCSNCVRSRLSHKTQVVRPIRARENWCAAWWSPRGRCSRRSAARKLPRRRPERDCRKGGPRARSGSAAGAFHHQGGEQLQRPRRFE